jgi:hypothetical protein
VFYFVGTAETDCEPTLATGFPRAKAYETVLVYETESQQTTKTPSVLAGKGMQKLRICDLNARRDMSGRFRTEAICHGPQLIAFFGIHSLPHCRRIHPRSFAPPNDVEYSIVITENNRPLDRMKSKQVREPSLGQRQSCDVSTDRREWTTTVCLCHFAT